MKNLSRRNKIRLLSFIAAAFCVCFFWAVSEMTQKNEALRVIRAANERSLSELDTYIDNIETSLKKGRYSACPAMLRSLSSELQRQTAAAKASMAQLSVGGESLENTYKFLSQVGGFTSALTKKSESGQELTRQETEQLDMLIEYAEGLSQDISYMRAMADSSMMDFSDDENISRENLRLSTAMSESEQSLTDYPSLIYDGPFSDNILTKESELLKGAKEIGREQAAVKAAELIEARPEQLQFVAEQSGRIPCFTFQCEGSVISIAKNGGYPVMLLHSGFVSEALISCEEAVREAAKFLNACGYRSMTESYYACHDGVCVVNFANLQNDVICYTDLIKVGVSLSDGKVISLDARGYIINHKIRRLNSPSISSQEAAGGLNSSLRVNSSQQALIPTDGGGERLCHEFFVTASGQDMLIYINGETGEEEDILLLSYSDNGTLTK